MALYAVAALVVGAAAGVAIDAGSGKHAQPSIAGGYDVAGSSSCLGERFDLTQSGRFVNVRNPTATLSGSLELRDGRLTGDVECAAGDTAALDARVAGGRLTGELGGRPVTAELKRPPPPPGSQQPRAPGSIEGEYSLTPRSDCLGAALTIEKDDHGGLELIAGEAEGEGRYAQGALDGQVTCADGSRRQVQGQAADRTIAVALAPPSAGGTPPAAGERVTATRSRHAGSLVAAFLIAVAVVMLVARLFGMAAVALRQPRVMGEVLAGIMLGPTALGLAFPGVQAALFPSDVIPYIGVVAQLGLVFYIFLVGLEVDLSQLRGRLAQVAAISNASVALPMVLGIAVAIPIYELVAPPTKFAGFALFMGVSMSVTAFPVLARILVERRMLKRPVGALVLASAAVDDVTAWLLIALASAVAVSGGGGTVARTVALAVVFCLVMAFVVRPLLARVSTAFDEAGRVPGGWIALIFAGVLLAAYATEVIGIALIFGAFVIGMVMPRHAELTEDVTRRIEDFVVTLLLPLFFAYTGLRTNVGLLDRPELWVLTGVLLAVAVVGKFGGASVAARLTGFSWRHSAVIGSLMNTRGLTELIVLNLALEKGAISQALFAMLVLMALVTTFAAGPALRLLDPRNDLGVPVEEELIDARQMSIAEFPALKIPQESIMLAPQGEHALSQLLVIAEPLAHSEPARELILARLVEPPRGAAARGGLQTENRLLEQASDEVNDVRRDLEQRGIAARATAFISTRVGDDLRRLASSQEVALVLMDGRRPLLGAGVPRGEVGAVLREAPCDVGVLVAKENDVIRPGPGAPVLVPFGGAEHDWAALELGAWIAAANNAPLKLLGAAGTTEDRARSTRLLGDAGLIVQQYSGLSSQTIVAEPGREGVVEAARGASLLVIGLSERWREEGLGATRSEIAGAAPAPVLFVRRGTRPGALAPRDDVTRFGWSAPGMGPLNPESRTL